VLVHNPLTTSEGKSLVLRYFDDAEILDATRLELAHRDGTHDEDSDTYKRFHGALVDDLLGTDKSAALKKLIDDVDAWSKKRENRNWEQIPEPVK